MCGAGWPLALAAAATLLCAASGGPAPTERFNLTLGYLPSIKGEQRDRQGLAISGAFTLALEEINSDPKILPQVHLALAWNDTRGERVMATRLLTDMVCEGVVAFFGPEGRCETEAIVSQARNLPMISYKCSDYQTSYMPTFARTEPPDTQATKSVISLLKYYRWNKFSILYEEAWQTVGLTLENHAKSNNMTVNHQRQVLAIGKCCEDKLLCCAAGFWYQFIQETKNRTRIYVYLGAPAGLIEMMLAMEALQLFAKGEYMVIYVDMGTYQARDALKYLINTEQLSASQQGASTQGSKPACQLTADTRRRAQSLLVVVSSEPDASYEEFTAKVRDYNTKPPFNFALPPIIGRKFAKYVTIYAAYLYDAVRLYATALDYLLRNETDLTEARLREIAENGTSIVETMVAMTPYTSIMGATIKLDERADSEGNFSVLAFKPNNDSDLINCSHNFVPVGSFHQTTRANIYPEYKLNPRLPIDWPDNLKPEDEPSCGFMNEKCPKDDSQVTSLVVAGTLAVTLFCALVITVSIYRKWKIEQEIEGLLWKIDPNDICGYFGADLICSPSKMSLVSAISYESRCGPQIFATTGQYRGNVVRIKELKFSKKKDISREVMKEMRLLRDLRHDNLNSFIGACVEPMRILLLTDYCSKGSLYDILENEDIKLDNMFISSLVHDLIKGMTFIHSSPLIYHGNLKSSNCVVTSRWLLQVTDFGLHELRYCAESESIGEHQYYRSLLWKSPELLRELDDPGGTVGGSQKGDVYAFSIIMYEIIGRRGPYGLTHLDPKDIVDRVKRGVVACGEYDEVFRPELCALEHSADESVLACMRDCWAEDPAARPDFPTIRTHLKKMKSGKSRNIMDQMMDMMEKYANNLEELVNERTRLLYEEKQKTEDLLHRMLPKSVAAKLTSGEGVEPETFDAVTIYFSDIVGFTALSAESTPLQVVNFLNDLYTIFDRIIRGYDVYKVETIGDAYMVVSGLPIRNNVRHVGEIASMSLDLLNAVKSHKISHKPNETLKLRIGIHTGAVVAGVVGLTMPRYCLFGDTVNTASRMESTGEALKIHISPSCKVALDSLGGYLVEPRGKIPIKGKGEIQTFWLLGATDKAIQKRCTEGEELRPLFCRPHRSPKLNDSRHPSLTGGFLRQSSVPRGSHHEGSCARSLVGSSSSLHRSPPPRLRTHRTNTVHETNPHTQTHKPMLSSIASSNACEDECKSWRDGTMRYAHSFDVLPAERVSRGKLEPLLALLNNQRNTSRSLEAHAVSAQDVAISTVSGKRDSGAFNGNVIGLSLEADNQNKIEEDSPLIRKCSLYNKVEQPKKKVPPDGNYVAFYKKWHSLENIDVGNSEMQRKVPRFAIRSWLLGIFGGNVRASNTSLRRAAQPAPLLADGESAV